MVDKRLQSESAEIYKIVPNYVDEILGIKSGTFTILRVYPVWIKDKCRLTTSLSRRQRLLKKRSLDYKYND